MLHANGRLAFGYVDRSRWCDGFLRTKGGPEMGVQSSLVTWIRFDQRINECVLCLHSQLRPSEVCDPTKMR
jgi:hypothetical protein